MDRILLGLCCLSLFASCGGADGTAEDTDGLAPENHRIFVSSASYTGNMGVNGLSDADDLCKGLAQNAGLTRDYKVVLSDASNNASARLTITGSVYIFSSAEDKNLVVANGVDFWDADDTSFLNKVNITESYASAAGVRVWSGTGVDGALVPGETCLDWKSASAGSTGYYGNPDSLTQTWIEDNSANCNNSYRIYCISQ